MNLTNIFKKTPPVEASEKNAPPFCVKETRLMGQLGISRDRVRELRQHFLKEDVDWKLIKNRVYLSSAAAETLRLKKDAAIPKKNGALPTEPNAALPAPKLLTWPTPFDGRLIVWASPGFNSRLLIAHLPDRDPRNPLNLVNVRVQSNRFFMRGEDIEARLVEGNTYNFIGRCPSYRGEQGRMNRLKKLAEK